MFDSGELLSVIEPPEWVVDDEVVDELDELNELDAVDGFIGCSKRQTSPMSESIQGQVPSVERGKLWAADGPMARIGFAGSAAMLAQIGV